MAVELATAYISLVPSAKGIATKLAEELGAPAEKAGKSAGGKLSGALGKVLKRGVVAVGAAAGAALGTALFKGWQRLTAIEEAQAKLEGLGHSAKGIRTIMDNALGAVRGTAFGLGDAATVAASGVAAGIKPGKDLRRVLGLVGDTASIAGSSLGEMGAIFNKVAASNRLSLGEVNQLADRGVPILQFLAKQYGVTQDEMAKMVSAGKVGFADFAKAIETNIGGAALSSGDTTQGAFANMGAAAGRFGASLLEGVFPITKKVFNGVTRFLDDATEKVKPFAEAFSTWVTTRVVPAAEKLLQKAGDLGDKIKEFFDSAAGEKLKSDTFEKFQSIFEKLSTAAKDLAPAVTAIAGSLGVASGAIGISTWELLLTTVDLLATAANTVLVPALEAIAGWMEDNQGAVTALVGAYTVWKLSSVAIAGALKVKAAWVAVNTARTKALAAAQKVARGAQVAWNVAVKAAGFAKLAGQMAVVKARTLAVSAATKTAAASQRLMNAAMAGARWAWQATQLVAYKVASVAVSAATKVWSGIQAAFNLIMSMNPIGLIVIGIMLLVGAIILAYKKSDTFRAIVDAAFKAIGAAAKWLWENAIKPAWAGIKKAFDVVIAVIKWWWKNVVTPAFNAVVAVAKWVWEKIKAYFGFWKGVFDKVKEWAGTAVTWIRDKFNWLVGVVKGLPKKISNAAKGMWDGIKNAFKAAINWLINKWNGLKLTIPSIDTKIPGIGKIGGFTLQTKQIPNLAKGGVIPATPGGRIVRVAEAGQAEAVIPLDRLDRMLGGGGSEVLELHLDLGEGIREVVRIKLREHDRQIKRRVLAGTGVR